MINSKDNKLLDAANSFAFLSKMIVDMMIEKGEISKSQEFDAGLAANKVLIRNSKIVPEIMSKDQSKQLPAIAKILKEIQIEMGIDKNGINHSSKSKKKIIVLSIFIAIAIIFILFN